MKPILAILSVVVFLSACEEIPPAIDFSVPYKTKDTTYIVASVPAAQHKAVLIEDITGVRCINCPQAAAKAKEIITEKTEDSVVAMALYINQLANFTTPWDGYPLLNTAIASNIVDFYGIPSGLPSGYVDRAVYAPQTVRFYAYTTWKNLVNQRLKLPTPVNIDIQRSLVNRQLTVNLKLQYTATVNTDQKYALYLIEDGIVSKQTGATDPENYVHNHALRYAFGNPLGNALTASLVPGRTFDKELEYTIPAEYNIDNCRLVCVITDVSSGEVVNVREVHVK